MPQHVICFVTTQMFANSTGLFSLIKLKTSTLVYLSSKQKHLFARQFSPAAWLYGTSVTLEPGQNWTIMHFRVGTGPPLCVNLNWSCWITLAMDWVPDKTASLFKATPPNTCRRNYSKDNEKQVKTWINQASRTVLYLTLLLIAQLKAWLFSFFLNGAIYQY